MIVQVVLTEVCIFVSVCHGQTDARKIDLLMDELNSLASL